MISKNIQAKATFKNYNSPVTTLTSSKVKSSSYEGLEAKAEQFKDYVMHKSKSSISTFGMFTRLGTVFTTAIFLRTKHQAEFEKINTKIDNCKKIDERCEKSNKDNNAKIELLKSKIKKYEELKKSLEV